MPSGLIRFIFLNPLQMWAKGGGGGGGGGGGAEEEGRGRGGEWVRVAK